MPGNLHAICKVLHPAVLPEDKEIIRRFRAPEAVLLFYKKIGKGR